MVTDDAYGIAKRLEFVAAAISELGAERVLDIGCGTGANLTVLLAQRFPTVQFIGIDSDPASIAVAQRENCPRNVRYLVEADTGDIGTFDLAIASEVIEHVEDPESFLHMLRARISPKGRLLLTMPNGLGPFEYASLIDTTFHLTGAYRVFKTIKTMIARRTPASDCAGTLAVSPHVNFFSHRQIRELIRSSGFAILSYQPRTFLCGFGFDQIMTSKQVIAWNAEVADRLPPQLVSAWMFLLAPAEVVSYTPYKRGWYAKFRRFLNQKRWKLK